MATDPIPYDDYEEGRDCNYWDLDPTLRREARRVYPDEAAYGVASGDRFAMENDVFAAVAHYASVEPDALVERAPAARSVPAATSSRWRAPSARARRPTARGSPA